MTPTAAAARGRRRAGRAPPAGPRPPPAAARAGGEKIEDLDIRPAAPLPPLLVEELAPELDRWLLEAELAIARTGALLRRWRGGRPAGRRGDGG
ncbi:MAG: hypothetical protein IPK78_17940 [Rhodospirillales bacterium]|nr:hypothetical protein [Rhodospirillales bacterium]